MFPDWQIANARHYAGFRPMQAGESTIEILNMYTTKIREILADCGKLSVNVAQLEDDSDLYQFGLTSLTTVNLMLAIEDCFDIEFPDAVLSRTTFQSISTLNEVVEDLMD